MLPNYVYIHNSGSLFLLVYTMCVYNLLVAAKKFLIAHYIYNALNGIPAGIAFNYIWFVQFLTLLEVSIAVLGSRKCLVQYFSF